MQLRRTELDLICKKECYGDRTVKNTSRDLWLIGLTVSCPVLPLRVLRGLQGCLLTLALGLGAFLGCDAVVADSDSVANVHHADDRLERGGFVGADHNRLVCGIVMSACSHQPLQFIQFRGLATQIEITVGVDVDHDLAWLAGHRHGAGRLG